jgi:predicted MPP superfamily phosphohydrolase
LSLLSILIRLFFTALAYFLPDLLIHGAVKKAWGKKVLSIYWLVNGILFAFIAASSFLIREAGPDIQRIQLLLYGLFVAILLAKLLISFILLLEDVVRIPYSLFTRKKRREALPGAPTIISRRQFLAKGAILTGLLPLTGILYGMVKGRFRYTIHKETVYLPNLPDAFDNFTITQLSDLHVGSFDPASRSELIGLVDMINELKSDAIFFTGDLVNSLASEMDDWYDVFDKMQAPVAKLSVLGNHDYGDYVSWPSESAKEENLNQVKAIHGKLDFQLLLNEHTVLEKHGEKLHVIGIENWGKGDFPKFGDLDRAASGLQPYDCMILLSHDPSFWQEFVIRSPFRPELTLSGHTHGFQMGLETPAFRFSPSQWIYEQWAGLYADGVQHLYVNRGLGTVGYPGRLGIWPEITQITLKKSLA